MIPSTHYQLKLSQNPIDTLLHFTRITGEAMISSTHYQLKLSQNPIDILLHFTRITGEAIETN